MTPYSPLGTLYAAAYLESKGYTTALFDSMLAENEQEIIPHLKKHQPKYVVIYDDDFNYLTKMCLSRMREAAFTISKIAKEFNCTVIVHGSDAADHVDDYLEHYADVVIFGEGEITLGELLDNLEASSSFELSTVNGLAFRHNGSIQKNPHRDVLQNLDVLPFPSRKLINIEQYRTMWKKRHGYFSMNMVTTRGCPFHCNWCAKPIYGQVYHSRSPEHVVEEMLLLKRDYHPDHLWFCDDIFGLKPGWVPKFADVVVERSAGIPYKCLSRADLLLKENTVHHLARSRCQTVWIGAESGSQKILDAMEKGTTVEQIYHSAKLLHEKGIRVGFFLQYGYPGETRYDIDLTLKMVKECKPDEIGISVSYPLPGTKFYETVKTQLGKKKNWVVSEDLDLMYTSAYHPDFYRTLHRLTHKKFKIWQAKDIFTRFLSNPFHSPKQSFRQVVSVVYNAITLPREQAKLNQLMNTLRSLS